MWVALIGLFAVGPLPWAYKTAYTENTYEFPRADGSKFKVISPTYEEASAFKDADQHGGVAAPPCKNGSTTCEPWDRKWEDSGLRLLRGAIVDAAGKIGGPYSIYDTFGFIKKKAAFYDEAKFWAWAGFAPPLLLGVLMLAASWAIAGFRSK